MALENINMKEKILCFIALFQFLLFQLIFKIFFIINGDDHL